MRPSQVRQGRSPRPNPPVAPAAARGGGSKAARRKAAAEDADAGAWSGGDDEWHLTKGAGAGAYKPEVLVTTTEMAIKDET